MNDSGDGAARGSKQERRRARAALVSARPMRLLFQRVGNRFSGTFGAAETLDQLREGTRATSQNVGNLVHLEAPLKLLSYSQNVRSAPTGNDMLGARAAEVERRYDGIVLSYANMIRAADEKEPDAHLLRGSEAEWLSATNCRIYVFGIGIQDKLEPRADVIDPRLFALLKVLNDKAEIFGVRGKDTEEWLHAIGLTNARAIGCPSMFVYPRNVMQIRSPTRDRALRVATAGRLQRDKDMDRFAAIVRVGAAFESSYVFQTDFYAGFRRHDEKATIYNDATGEVLGEPVRSIGQSLGFDLPFRNYWLFRSTEKWRGFTIGMDAYFGDRFHGGVIFMQGAKPAIIVQNDGRVKELTAFFDIPTATSSDIIGNDPVDLLHERLGDAALRQLRETYAARYRQFYDVLSGAGLQLFNDITPDAIDAMV